MVHELRIPISYFEEQGKIATDKTDVTEDFIRQFGDEDGISGLSKVEKINILDLEYENSEWFSIYRAYDEDGKYVEFDHPDDIKEFLYDD